MPQDRWTFLGRDMDGALHVAKVVQWTRNTMTTSCGKRDTTVIAIGSVQTVALEHERELCSACLIKEVVP